VGFLVLTGIPLVLALLIHLGKRPWRSPRGAERLARLRDQAPRLVDRAAVSDDPTRAALAFALVGAAALPPDDAFLALRNAFTPPPATASGGCGAHGGCGAAGCGGGGGGGCGGGGGGCGGGGCGG
jgi:hypothetical protein